MNNVDLVIPVGINWVKASQFALISGYSVNSIRKKGESWEDHILWTAPDKNLMVNIRAFEIWATGINTRLNSYTLALNVITARVYADISGYTLKALQRKREEKIWSNNHIFHAPDGNLMINIYEVEKWIRKG